MDLAELRDAVLLRLRDRDRRHEEDERDEHGDELAQRHSPTLAGIEGL
jgi:hypothetical protein